MKASSRRDEMELDEIQRISEFLKTFIEWHINQLKAMKIGEEQIIDGQRYKRINDYRWSCITKEGKELVLAMGSKNKITIL